MISRSIYGCVEFVFVPRSAGRNIPMTGIDRSKLSYRTFFILFFFLASPMAGRSSTLEDSAGELARKIAAALPLREGVAVDVQNISTLTPKEVDRVSQAVTGILQESGFKLEGGANHVSVTLSENVKGFLWSAEISRGDSLQVVLTAVPRNLEDRPVSNSMPILLRGEKFWEGPEQILDATELTTSKEAGTLLLLQPDGLIIHKKDSDTSLKVEIPSPQAATRTLYGSIEGENACRLLEFSPCVTVILDSRICTIAVRTRSVGECHVQGPASARDFAALRPFLPGTLPRGRSEPIIETSTPCGTEIQLGVGSGDYTQPDSVQAFNFQAATYVPLSNELSFPGPVMRFHMIDHVPTAIVRNLQTGNYEAYRISITCAE